MDQKETSLKSFKQNYDAISWFLDKQKSAFGAISLPVSKHRTIRTRRPQNNQNINNKNNQDITIVIDQNTTFLPNPFFKNDNFFPQVQLKCPLFSPLFHLFPLIFAFFLVNHHIFFPGQRCNTSYFAPRGDRTGRSTKLIF